MAQQRFTARQLPRDYNSNPLRHVDGREEQVVAMTDPPLLKPQALSMLRSDTCPLIEELLNVSSIPKLFFVFPPVSFRFKA
jgi:hypothetical protein